MSPLYFIPFFQLIANLLLELTYFKSYNNTFLWLKFYEGRKPMKTWNCRWRIRIWCVDMRRGMVSGAIARWKSQWSLIALCLANNTLSSFLKSCWVSLLFHLKWEIWLRNFVNLKCVCFYVSPSHRGNKVKEILILLQNRCISITSILFNRYI